jgi:tetrahydrodipicolinate N-succinyltransferase
VLNVAYNKSLDAVGKIDIRDNVFIGYNAVILPNVTIGPNAIVAAGSIVTKDVPPGTIVGGNPAKVIGSVEEYVAKLQERTNALPWREIIERRGLSGHEPAFEAELKRARVKHFYGSGSQAPS